MEYRTLFGFISAFMVLFHILYYKNIKGDRIPFPLYIYIAMWPFRMEMAPYTLFQYQDNVIKVIEIIGLAMLIGKHTKVKFNLFEIAFLCSVISFDIINFDKVLYFQQIGNGALTILISLVNIYIISFYSYNTINNKEKLAQLLKIFFCNSLVLSAMTLYEYFIGGMERPEATLMNPNYLAIYLLISALCYIYVCKKKVSINNILYLFLIVSSIIITGSNAVLLALIIVICLNITSIFKSKIMYVSSIVVIIIMIIFYMNVILNINEYNTGLLKYFVKSEDMSRVYIWQYTFNEFKQHPIVGVGWSIFRYPGGYMDFVTHNDYLRILVELGVIGFGIFIYYISYVFRMILKYKDNNTKLFLFSINLTLLIYSLTHNYTDTTLFWLFISLALNKKAFTRC